MTAPSNVYPRIWQRSPIVLVLKWLFSRHGARVCLFAAACLVTLIALFYTEENWRGRHVWEKHKRTQEARGERLSFIELAPPPVPDDQNFAMTPLLKPLFPRPGDYGVQLRQRLELCGTEPAGKKPGFGDWMRARPIDLQAWRECLRTTNILQTLTKFDSELDEINTASRRPYARFPLRYEDGFAVWLPHLPKLRQLARLYELRTCAEIAEGQPDRAAMDVETILRLADSLKDGPLLISELVRIDVLQLGVQPIWEGLCRHQWSDSQLATFQNKLQRIDFLSGCLRALQGNRASLNDFIERGIEDRRTLFLVGVSIDDYSGGTNEPPPLLRASIELMPRGWLYQNMLSADRYYQEHLFAVVDLAERRISPQKERAAAQRIEDLGRHYAAYPYNFFVLTAVSSWFNWTAFAKAQTAVDEANIACALERYRLAHGELPDRLDALTPQFITKLPHDVIDGQPLKYHRTGDDQFVLYSVGWNETDEGGVVALSSRFRRMQDEEPLDWVWFSQPQPSASERK